MTRKPRACSMHAARREVFTDLLGVEDQGLGGAGLRVRHGRVVRVEAMQEVRLLVQHRVVLRDELIAHLQERCAASQQVCPTRGLATSRHCQSGNSH